MTKGRNNNTALRKLTRSLKWLVPLVVVVGLVLSAFRPKPVEVDLGTVARGFMQVTVDDDGETRVRERYTISAPLAGRLLRLGLDPGDKVKQGDILATIDPGAPNLLDPRARAQAEALVKAAEAAMERAQSQLDMSKTDAVQLEKAYLRDKILHDKGNIADAKFEQSERAHFAAQHSNSAAQSAVEMARFELEQAEAALLRFDDDASAGGEETLETDWSFSIHSPIDAEVLRVHEESTRMLPSGTPLLELGNPKDLEMRIDVLSQDAVKIEPGQKVIVEHWGGDAALTGRVRLVEPSAYTKVSALGVEEQRVNVIADFEPENGSSLGDGYRIEARIVVWEKKDALQVPAGALFRIGENWGVYRADGKRARLIPIEIGRNNGEVAEVLSGLNAKDRVILHPGDRVEDGAMIKPRS